jgi:hypothetical protein
MKMPRQDFRKFVKSFENYAIDLTRVLPYCLRVQDPIIGEEIDHILFTREVLEEIFERYPDDPKLMPYRLRMLSLDAELLLRRKDILANYPLKNYRRLRRQNHTPHAHWWWYLDEVDASLLSAPAVTQPRGNSSTTKTNTTKVKL